LGNHDVKVIHLTASPFYGGPERQMLGLGQALRDHCQSVYVSFPERGLARPFLARAAELGFESIELEANFPRFRAVIQELTQLLQRLKPDVLCCHNYKPNLFGWFAARRTGTPIVAVIRGWTGSTRKVRLYDTLDSLWVRWMDAVVCVSEGMAVKARRAGVPATRMRVIRNAINTQRFDNPDPAYREKLQAFFALPRKYIIGAAGRLSADKGFTYLIQAAQSVCQQYPEAGFVIFGDGPHKEKLSRQIQDSGLQEQVVLAGFQHDLDRWMAMLDLFVLPSFAEGLPNVVLEAFAAGVPVVATAVDGTPEVVDDGISGWLVPPGDANTLARRILEMLDDDDQRQEMGRRGQERVRREFTFSAQAEQYYRLFEQLTAKRDQEQHPDCRLRFGVTPFTPAAGRV
jgi:glycosyltransferase involved in cell wall biosynthesis